MKPQKNEIFQGQERQAKGPFKQGSTLGPRPELEAWAALEAPLANCHPVWSSGCFKGFSLQQKRHTQALEQCLSSDFYSVVFSKMTPFVPPWKGEKLNNVQ
jgi:hypothetical protein